MKKNLIIITILFMLLGVFGINQINNQNQERETEVKEIAQVNKEKEGIVEKIEENTSEEEADKEGLVSLYEKSNEYTGLENIKVIFEKKSTEDAKYYMVVTAYDVNTNKVLWTYESDKDYVGQLDYIDFVYDEEDNEKVYIVTEKNISKLDMTTGKVLWKNKLNVKLYSGIGYDDKLYFMGAYDDTMYIIDTNKGKVVDSIKVNEGEYTYEFITSMDSILIFGYYSDDVNYIEFDVNTNTVINK